MYKEMSKMSTKQLGLVKSLTLAAFADGKMGRSERDDVLNTMKRVLVERIKAKRN